MTKREQAAMELLLAVAKETAANADSDGYRVAAAEIRNAADKLRAEIAAEEASARG
jgi:hypothetical protein